MELDDKEVQEFKTEAEDLLQDAENHLLLMEQPLDFNKHYSAVFRDFHSLKGAAGMLELVDLKEHMHKVESLFSQYQEKSSLQAEEVTFFLKSVDVARSLLKDEKVEFSYEIQKIKNTHQTSPDAIEEKKAKIAAKNTPLIYIVDDEPELLVILVAIIEPEGHRIECFNSPKELLLKCQDSPPDLILSDMRMPELSGMDVYKKIKEIDSEIPFIFISAYLDKPTLIDALNLGVFAVLDKPIKENQLINFITQALNHRETLRLLNRSIDMILFQITELEKFLNSQGKNNLVEIMKHDVRELLSARRALRGSQGP